MAEPETTTVELGWREKAILSLGLAVLAAEGTVDAAECLAIAEKLGMPKLDISELP